jgi:hypothetical protein
MVTQPVPSARVMLIVILRPHGLPGRIQVFFRPPNFWIDQRTRFYNACHNQGQETFGSKSMFVQNLKFGLRRPCVREYLSPHLAHQPDSRQFPVAHDALP